MSATVSNPNAVPVVESDQPSFLRGGKLKNISTLLAIVLGIASAVVMFGTNQQQYMLNSWVFAFMFWALLSLGCLGLNLLYNSVKGSWTSAVVRLMEAGSSWQMWLTLFLVFVPVLLNLPQVYEWADPNHIDYILRKKAPYLNTTHFTIRVIAFMLLWAALSAGLRASGLRQEKTGDKNEEQRRANWATPGILVFVLTLTFAVTDWGMSLTPHWYSTIYGLWLMVGGAQAALSLTTLLVCLNATKKPYNEVVAPALTKDLGNMMFVLTMLWGYTSLSQLLIIWNGNLPETTTFYVHRGSDAGLGWAAIGASTMIGCWLVPFMTLLSPRIKRYPIRLARIAGWIFVFRIVDLFSIIGAAVPHRATPTAVPTLHDALAFLTIGAIWFAVWSRRIEKAPLLPGYDRRLQEMKLHAH